MSTVVCQDGREPICARADMPCEMYLIDAGPPDTGRPDTGVRDTSLPDTGPPDAPIWIEPPLVTRDIGIPVRDR